MTSPAPLPEITRELEEILTNGKDAFGSIDILIRAVANFYFFSHELDLRGAKNFGIVAQDILTKYPALSIATVNIAKKQNATPTSFKLAQPHVINILLALFSFINSILPFQKRIISQKLSRRMRNLRNSCINSTSEPQENNKDQANNNEDYNDENDDEEEDEENMSLNDLTKKSKSHQEILAQLNSSKILVSF